MTFTSDAAGNEDWTDGGNYGHIGVNANGAPLFSTLHIHNDAVGAYENYRYDSNGD